MVPSEVARVIEGFGSEVERDLMKGSQHLESISGVELADYAGHYGRLKASHAPRRGE